MKPQNRRNSRGATLNLLVLCALILATLGMPSSALAVAPSNDLFSNPVAITSIPATITMSDDVFNDANDSTNDPLLTSQTTPAPGCPYSNAGVHTIWYTFTPTSYGKLTIDTYGSGFDTIIAIWTKPGVNLLPVACNDDTSAGVGPSEIKNLQLLAGTKYYIEVVQYTSGGGAPAREQEPSAFIPDYMTLNVSFSEDLNIAVPGIKYDDKSPVFNYTGAWTNTTATKAYQGSFKLSRTIGNKATVTFDGIQFKVYYTRGTTYGRLAMYLDGSATPINATDINQYGFTAYQSVYTSPVFSEGIHTVEFRHTTRYVTIDAIEIIAAPDPTPPAAINDLTAAPGATYGFVDLAWTAVGDDDMDGAAMAYDLRYSSSPIVDETAWNAATQLSDEPAPKPAGEPETLTLSLVPGVTYHFAIRALDEPADTTPGGLSNSPNATAPFLGPNGAGIYDDAHPGWMYLGTWTTVNAGFATSGHYRYSAVAGNSAAFVFNGTRFTFTYLMNSYGGIAEVRVDGVAVKQINMKYTVALWKRAYTLTGLASGQHTVQIIHLSGARIYVDDITIQ